jgi:prevent-host-death family protein
VKQAVWQIQEAKNKLSEVIDRALRQGPQIITRRGVEAVIVLSYQEYRKLLLSRTKLSDFFRESPLTGTPLDVPRAKGSWRNDVNL